MVEKRLLCPHRRRRTPAQFSWLDHRLVRERRLERCPVEAWGAVPVPRHRGRRAGAELLLRRLRDRARAPGPPRAPPPPATPSSTPASSPSSPRYTRCFRSTSTRPPRLRLVAAALLDASARCCNNSGNRHDRLRHLPTYPASAIASSCSPSPRSPTRWRSTLARCAAGSTNPGSAPGCPVHAPASSTPSRATPRLLEHHPYSAAQILKRRRNQWRR